MDFIDIIGKQVGREPKVKLAPRHPADTLETWSNTNKLQELGYKPKTNIEVGVQAFVDWYKYFYKGELMAGKDNIPKRARRIMEMQQGDVYDPSDPNNVYDNDMEMAPAGTVTPEPKLKIGIVGHGFVGKAVDYAFTHKDVEKFFVDPKYGDGHTIDDLIDWSPHFCFVCAPTPMSEDGFVDASIVEDSVLKLFEHTEVLLLSNQQ